MNKLLVSVVSVALVTSACAQQNPTAVKYAEVISPALAKKQLSIIASDAFEGRETGKPGAEKAAHYIADEFKSLGLQGLVNGSYYFDVPLVENSLKMSVTVNGQPYFNGQDFYAFRSYADRFFDTKEIIFVGYGTESEIANTDLTGKTLLWINEDKPQDGTKTNINFRPSETRLQIIKNLQSKNPSVILGVNPGMADVIKKFSLSMNGERLIIKNNDNEPLPQQAAVLLITTAMANQLIKLSGKTFDDLKGTAINGNVIPQSIKSAVKISYHTDFKDVKAVDIIGYLPGSDPKFKDEVLVISAHYDHIGMLPEGTKGDRINNGADDDGSGTTGIMEIARAFSLAKKHGYGPRRSILFLANVGEEKGLLGSAYYTDHPVIPLANTIANLNMDMIGRIGYDHIGMPDSANYVYVIGSSMLSTDMYKASEKANALYTKLYLDYKYDNPNDPNRFYYRSDHYNFAKHGIPIIFYSNGEHKDYHGVGDEVSKINFPLLAKRAQLVFYTAWYLVNADTRPVVDGKN